MRATSELAVNEVGGSGKRENERCQNIVTIEQQPKYTGTMHAQTNERHHVRRRENAIGHFAFRRIPRRPFLFFVAHSPTSTAKTEISSP